MRRDENGYIVVETIGCFVLFVLLMFSILSLINIVAVQARIHYALTQAAETVSMYSYVLEATGAAGHLTNLAEGSEAVTADANKMKENINGVINGLESLSSEDVINNGKAAVSQAQGWVESAVDDPKSSLQTLLQYTLGQAENAAFGAVMRPLVGHYLTNGTMSGDAFLKSFSVIDGLDGLTFYTFDLFDLDSKSEQNSAFLTSSGDIKLTVQYDIDYTFGALMIPFSEPKIHVTQSVVTKAWLGGKGEGYQSS